MARYMTHYAEENPSTGLLVLGVGVLAAAGAFGYWWYNREEPIVVVDTASGTVVKALTQSKATAVAKSWTKVNVGPSPRVIGTTIQLLADGSRDDPGSIATVQEMDGEWKARMDPGPEIPYSAGSWAVHLQLGKSGRKLTLIVQPDESVIYAHPLAA